MPPCQPQDRGHSRSIPAAGGTTGCSGKCSHCTPPTRLLMSKYFETLAYDRLSRGLEQHTAGMPECPRRPGPWPRSLITTGAVLIHRQPWNPCRMLSGVTMQQDTADGTALLQDICARTAISTFLIVQTTCWLTSSNHALGAEDMLPDR